MTIIIDNGFDALTIARLARELGVAVGGIYRYFSSKDDLLLALQRRALDALVDDLKDDLKMAESYLSDTSERLQSQHSAVIFMILVSSATILSDALRYPERHNLIQAATTHLKTSLKDALMLERSFQPLLGELRFLIDSGMRRGALNRADTLQRAYLLWAALNGLDAMRARDRVTTSESLTFKPLCNHMVRSLLMGWGCSKATLDEAFEHLRFDPKLSVVFF